MTIKQKAVELVAKFTGLVECEIAGENGFEFSKDMQVDNAKICAKIVVQEIMKEYTTLPHFGELYDENINYWEDVKQDIEKL
jgi:hypothetical protein